MTITDFRVVDLELCFSGCYVFECSHKIVFMVLPGNLFDKIPIVLNAFRQMLMFNSVGVALFRSLCCSSLRTHRQGIVSCCLLS